MERWMHMLSQRWGENGNRRRGASSVGIVTACGVGPEHGGSGILRKERISRYTPCWRSVRGWRSRREIVTAVRRLTARDTEVDSGTMGGFPCATGIVHGELGMRLREAAGYRFRGCQRQPRRLWFGVGDREIHLPPRRVWPRSDIYVRNPTLVVRCRALVPHVLPRYSVLWWLVLRGRDRSDALDGGCRRLVSLCNVVF